MGSIRATQSSISSFEKNCKGEYVSILNTANEILERIEKMQYEVRQDIEKISRQIDRLDIMKTEIEDKVTYYKGQRDSYSDEMDSCTERINYLLNNPTEITETDSDGNEVTTTVYDDEGIRCAERERECAYCEYKSYGEKYSEAYGVYTEVNSTFNRYRTIRKAINSVSDSLENDIFEIKKYTVNIEDEARHNINSLGGVIDSISDYLASKSIYMPDGTVYKDFNS